MERKGGRSERGCESERKREIQYGRLCLCKSKCQCVCVLESSIRMHVWVPIKQQIFSCARAHFQRYGARLLAHARYIYIYIYPVCLLCGQFLCERLLLCICAVSCLHARSNAGMHVCALVVLQVSKVCLVLRLTPAP